MDKPRTRAGMEYTDKGVEILRPTAPVVEEKLPWVPKVGLDTRDTRDPQTIGKKILARVKRRKK